jgi:hypothetical protein
LNQRRKYYFGGELHGMMMIMRTEACVVGFTIGSRGERKPVIKEQQRHNNNQFNSLFYVLHKHNNNNNNNNNKGICYMPAHISLLDLITLIFVEK